MRRFFIRESDIKDSKIIITGQDAVHISDVLRIAPGEIIILCNGEKIDYECEILTVNRSAVTVHILKKISNQNEPKITVTLFQALPKADKMETIIQKSVEIGIFRIIPVASSRCVVVLSEKDGIKKCEKWQKISNEAAKQSQRGILPEVGLPQNIKKINKLIGPDDLSLMAWENSENSLKKVLGSNSHKQNINIFIGPEGGISENEAKFLSEGGFKPVSLGKRILRTETAGLALLSAVMYHWDEM